MELKGPSEAEIKKFIKFETKIEFVTTGGQHFKGTVLWADDNAFHIKLENDRTVTLLRNATIYYSTF